MKIYLVNYNIDEREPKKIFVSQYSSYKIGIKVNGVDNSKIKLSKKTDGKVIAVEDDFKGYNTYNENWLNYLYGFSQELQKQLLIIFGYHIQIQV